MKKEVKIGIFAVAMIGAAWAGLRFLSGLDILSRNAEYYAVYDQVNGVQNASPIMMRGVKIGTVTAISLDPSRSDKVVLHLNIQRKYRIPNDSEAKIVSNGLMGNKAIELLYGSSSDYLRSGDTLRTGRDRDLMEMAGSELDFLKQQFAQISSDLTATLQNLNGLLERNAAHIDGTLGNLDALSGDMATLLRNRRESLDHALENLEHFTQTLGDNAPRIDSMIGNLNSFSAELTEAQLVDRLSKTVDELSATLAAIEGGDGTLARLLHDPELYESVDEAIDNLSALLADLKAYPARYVHFSLFGRDPEKLKAKAERQAAKAAEKARQDSLKALR